MRNIIALLLLATTLHAQQGGWGRDKSSLSTSGDVTAGGTVSGTTIVQGTDTLNDLLADKADSDVLDTSSVGDLGANGTNTVLSAFDDLLLRRTVDWPATALTGGAVEIDWATEAVKSIVATGDLSITDANRPTNTYWVTGYGSITNSSASSVAVAWPSGWTPVTGVELTNILSEYTVFMSWTWDGSKVWYSYETKQTDPLPDTYGGTGRSSLTENAVMVGAGTGPIKLLSAAQGLSVSTNELVGWDKIEKLTHTNDDVVLVWSIPVPTNQSFHGYADVRSSGGAGGMLRHEAYGGFWRDADAGLADGYTNTVSHGASGGNAYWYTNDNSAALYVVGIDSYNWRTWAGIRYDLMDNPDVPEPAYTILWHDSFEGTGTEESWTASLGSTWDHDNTAQYLYGAQSSYHTNASERHMIRTTQLTNNTMSVMLSMRISSWPIATSQCFPIAWVNAAASQETYVQISSTGKLGVRVSGSVLYTTDSVPTDTWFNIWASSTTDRAGNVSVEAGFSTDTTKPTSGDKYKSNTTAAQTTTFDAVQFNNQAGAYTSGEMWIDGFMIIAEDYDALPDAFPE